MHVCLYKILKDLQAAVGILESFSSNAELMSVNKLKKFYNFIHESRSLKDYCITRVLIALVYDCEITSAHRGRNYDG